MSQGIREAALSKPTPKTPYCPTAYLPYGQSYDYDDPFDLPAYKTVEDRDEPYAPAKHRNVENIILDPNCFEISTAIQIEELGPVGDPDTKEFSYETMLDEAEKIALIKIEKLIPEVHKNFTIEMDSVENIDDITVMATLTPINN